jgi:hypothetical protein
MAQKWHLASIVTKQEILYGMTLFLAAIVVTSRNSLDIRPNDEKRFFGPIKSAVACRDLLIIGWLKN